MLGGEHGNINNEHIDNLCNGGFTCDSWKDGEIRMGGD
nr:MAG TPA: hypothetical protein [Caudoviricetes sp.]